jgi:predicted O-methyltransferase YrrM
MSTLMSPLISKHLKMLFADAEASDKPVKEQLQKLSRDERNALEHDHRHLYGVLARKAYLPVTPEFGRLLYLLARSMKAKTIVEFGTSFGISTIHLAAALRDSGGGVVIATEYEPSKAERARKNFEAVELADLIDLRVGDALETLRDGNEKAIDLVLLDGPKDLYLAVLKLLEPKLRINAVVAADNTKDMSEAMASYLEYVRDGRNGYISVDLPVDHGNEISLRIGTPAIF